MRHFTLVINVARSVEQLQQDSGAGLLPLFSRFFARGKDPAWTRLANFRYHSILRIIS